MAKDRAFHYWPLIIIILLIIIVAGSLVIRSKLGRSQVVEISLAPEVEQSGEIYVGGEVNNPGLYPLRAGDSFDDIIRAAGGPTDNAVMNRLVLQVPGQIEGELPQKVDINRAEAWLLAALPEIGETRARAIIDYRQKNGPFHSSDELVKVPGIGSATYEKIKQLVTVAE